MTQDKTVYQAKAKFFLVRIEQFEINTVYCVELFLNGTKESTFIPQWWTSQHQILND